MVKYIVIDLENKFIEFNGNPFSRVSFWNDKKFELELYKLLNSITKKEANRLKNINKKRGIQK
jgi:hypothetical protein